MKQYTEPTLQVIAFETEDRTNFGNGGDNDIPASGVAANACAAVTLL